MSQVSVEFKNTALNAYVITLPGVRLQCPTGHFVLLYTSVKRERKRLFSICARKLIVDYLV